MSDAVFIRSRRGVARAAGFTLVELAVAMAMLATLATLAYPSLAEWLAKRRVVAAAETLAGDLGDARLLAAQKARTVHVNFSSADAPCWALATSDGCDCRVPQACRLKARRLGEFRGVSLTGPASAQFSADGLGEGAAELRSARGHLLRVQVSRLGRANICAPVGGEARYPAC